MRAIEYTQNGDADVLQLVERNAREPGAGEVRVRIAVSGVNPTDWKSRQGGRTAPHFPRPQVPNQDGAGVVDAVGPGVTGFAARRPGLGVGCRLPAHATAPRQELAIVPVGAGRRAAGRRLIRRRRIPRHASTHRASRLTGSGGPVRPSSHADSLRGHGRARRRRRRRGQPRRDPARRVGGRDRAHHRQQ